MSASPHDSYNYTTIVDYLEGDDPNLDFSRIRRPWHEGRGFERIDRNGIAYHADKDCPLLNPCPSPLGHGLRLVKGSDSDPTGAFFTEEGPPTDEERLGAVEACLFKLGAPRPDIYVLPATLWPRRCERTPEDIRALRQMGAPLPHGRRFAE